MSATFEMDDWERRRGRSYHYVTKSRAARDRLDRVGSSQATQLEAVVYFENVADHDGKRRLRSMVGMGGQAR